MFKKHGLDCIQHSVWSKLINFPTMTQDFPFNLSGTYRTTVFSRMTTFSILSMDKPNGIRSMLILFIRNILQDVKWIILSFSRLCFQIHPLNNTEVMIKTWKMLRLLEKSGFKKWHFHLNVEGPWNRYIPNLHFNFQVSSSRLQESLYNFIWFLRIVWWHLSLQH